MQNHDVAALLAHDIEANMAIFQLAGLAASLALAIIGVVLSMRAYAVLSEARALYWQTNKLNATGASKAGPHAAPSTAINASHPKRKIKSNRLRGIM